MDSVPLTRIAQAQSDLSPHPPSPEGGLRRTRERGEVGKARCFSYKTDARLCVPSRQPQPRLDLGDFGAADRDPMWRRAVEFDHRAVTLLADEGDVGDRHDVAAMHPDEQPGIELGFGLRDRPRAHPLAGAVMDFGVMRVGPDATDFS